MSLAMPDALGTAFDPESASTRSEVQTYIGGAEAAVLQHLDEHAGRNVPVRRRFVVGWCSAAALLPARSASQTTSQNCST